MPCLAMRQQCRAALLIKAAEMVENIKASGGQQWLLKFSLKFQFVIKPLLLGFVASVTHQNKTISFPAQVDISCWDHLVPVPPGSWLSLQEDIPVQGTPTCLGSPSTFLSKRSPPPPPPCTQGEVVQHSPYIQLYTECFAPLLFRGGNGPKQAPAPSPALYSLDLTNTYSPL